MFLSTTATPHYEWASEGGIEEKPDYLAWIIDKVEILYKNMARLEEQKQNKISIWKQFLENEAIQIFPSVTQINCRVWAVFS